MEGVRCPLKTSLLAFHQQRQSKGDEIRGQHMADGLCGVGTVFSDHRVAPGRRLSQQRPPALQVQSTLMAWRPHSCPRPCPPGSLGLCSAQSPSCSLTPVLSFLCWCLRALLSLVTHEALPPSCVLVLAFQKPQPSIRTSRPLLVCKSPERFTFYLLGSLINNCDDK